MVGSTMAIDRRHTINVPPAKDPLGASVRFRVPTPAPRQYRPTYNYCSSTDSTPNFGYPLANQRPQVYNRRRTAPTFPAPGPLQGPPTVASSKLTSSVSIGNVSRPAPSLQRRLSQPRQKTSSRVPTPVLNRTSSKATALDNYSHGKGKLQGISNDGQSVLQDQSIVGKNSIMITSQNTPVESGKMGRGSNAIGDTASMPTLKENVLPKPNLLGPIQVESVGLPRSRTRSVLATLTSSISTSRSTPALGTSGNASAVSLLAKSDTRLVSLPLPTFSDDFGQVSHHVPSSYWSGRFTALRDRYRGEILDSPFLEIQKSKVYDVGPEEETELTPFTRDEEKLGKRVFLHLEALCLTIEAKASLWRFQQDYARLVNCDALLPVGGSMSSKSNFMAKARRMLPGGRKTGHGVASREVSRKRSSLSTSCILE